MERPLLLSEIDRRLGVAPVVALLGPRQCGKTTLARMYTERLGTVAAANRFDLEDPRDLNRLEEPTLALEPLRGLVVLDEIQRRPDLFPYLRTLVDRDSQPARFLVLGSASRDLIQQSSETLAGRISFLEVTPFSLQELAPSSAEDLWVRGGFPRSFLATSDEDSLLWRTDFIRTFLERDIPALGITIPAEQLRRFWLMLVHSHGQVFNASELGRSLGIAHTTAQRYLDILAGTFMVRRLPPWFENLGKRQVKRPRIYLRDSGILHALLGLTTHEDLLVHPKLGASWEGFALEEILRLHRATEGEAYFWSVHQQCEIDLLLLQGGKRKGFEVKYSGAPRLTPSLRQAKDLLQLSQVTIVCPGDQEYDVAEDVRVTGLNRLVAAFSAGETG